MPGGRAPGAVTSTISSAQPGREDQPAARQFRQERDVDAPVDDEFLEPHHAGMYRLQLDARIVAAHAQRQFRAPAPCTMSG